MRHLLIFFTNRNRRERKRESRWVSERQRENESVQHFILFNNDYPLKRYQFVVGSFFFLSFFLSRLSFFMCCDLFWFFLLTHTLFYKLYKRHTHRVPESGQVWKQFSFFVNIKSSRNSMDISVIALQSYYIINNNNEKE